MESNKDEAYHCLRLAIRAMNQGNFEKAEKLARTAERMYPSEESKSILKQFESKSFKIIDERPKTQLNVSNDELKSEIEYTKEQMDAVNRIKTCKENFYEMLCITKNARDLEIRKAYKILALLVHPDKNKAPGSAQAFTNLKSALDTLTDPYKKRTYDLKVTSNKFSNINSQNFQSKNDNHENNGNSGKDKKPPMNNVKPGTSNKSGMNMNNKKPDTNSSNEPETNNNPGRNNDRGGCINTIMLISGILISALIFVFLLFSVFLLIFFLLFPNLKK